MANPSRMLPAIANLREGASAAASRMGSAVSALTGGRSLRYNRFFDKLNQSSVVLKVPQDFGTDEENVVLGMSAGAVAIAAAASATITVNAPRDLILRRLYLVDILSSTNQDFVVTAIQIEGKAFLIGGSIPGAVFGNNNFNAPAHFDVPVAGGTPISITVTNTGAGGIELLPTWTID